MFNKLRNKFLMLSMTIISILMLAAFSVIYLLTYNYAREENQTRLDRVADIPIGAPMDMSQGRTTGPNDSYNIISISTDFSMSFTLLLDNSGRMINGITYINLSDEDYLEAANIVWQAGRDGDSISLAGRKWLYRMSAIPRTTTYLVYNQGAPFFLDVDESRYQITFLDITDSSKMLSQLLMTFLFIGLGVLIIIFLVSYSFANRAILPIAEAWDRQKQFVADASHELRTPLAIINANSDVLLANKEESVVSQEKWIEYIRSQTDRMNKLVDDLLCLAQVEEKISDSICSPFDMGNMINDAMLSMEAVIYEKGISLSRNIEPAVIINSDYERLKQVVMILLDNAVKYTEASGNIEIMLERKRQQLVFSIKNSGTGVPADELLRLFDRFYRADKARSRETGGYGLGLSIAKAIIEGLGGRIGADSVEDKYMVFTFVLNM